MRASSGVLIAVGTLLSAVVTFLLLFWFAFPRWWPEVVIRHSPSLGHVMLADSYRCEVMSFTTSRGAIRCHGIKHISDYHSFEQSHGERMFAEMAACDDGSNMSVRWVIIEYLGKHLEDAKARKIVWEYSDQGDEQAHDLVIRHASSMPQGIDASRTLRDNTRKEPSPSR